MNTNLNIVSYFRKISAGRNVAQIGIVVATLFATLIAAYWGTVKILAIVIVLTVSLFGLIFLLKYPNLGYIFMFLGGWFVRYYGQGGMNVAMLMLIFMFVLWFLDMFVVKRKLDFVHSRTLRPAGYFMIISVIAFVVGQIRWFSFANQAPLSAQLGGFSIYFFLVGSMILTANILRDIRWLKAFIWVFVGLGTVFIILTIAHVTKVIDLLAYGAYTNSMFWTWLVIIPFGQAVFNHELKLKHRLVLFAIVAITFYAGILNRDWKSGWVPPAVAVMVLLALRFKKLLIFVVPLAIIYAGTVVGDLISSDQYSWGSRFDAWVIVLGISKVSPLIGLGFANYYWYVRLVGIRGYYVRFNSHNQYVDFIAQTGIAGLFCFMWIIFEVGRLSWNLMQKLSSGFERGFAYAVFGGIFGTLMGAFLGDWVLPFTYNIGLDGVRASVLPWIFFGALVAIEQMHKEELNP